VILRTPLSPAAILGLFGNAPVTPPTQTHPVSCNSSVCVFYSKSWSPCQSDRDTKRNMDVGSFDTPFLCCTVRLQICMSEKITKWVNIGVVLQERLDYSIVPLWRYGPWTTLTSQAYSINRFIFLCVLITL
jgi:hypothetical protein